MKVFANQQTPYQHVLLYERNGHVRLLLDGYYQFDSRHEKTYHEMIAALPMALAAKIRRVLVMGGGDALALREILRYPVDQVTLVELDPEMIRLAASEPLRSLNEAALSDRRTRIAVGDAAEFVRRAAEQGDRYDVVIADFPALTDRKLAKLYDPDFYRDIRKILSRGGIFVQQISEQGRFGEAIRRLLDRKFGRAVRLYVSKGRIPMESFVMASDEPFSKRRPFPPEATFIRTIWKGLVKMLSTSEKHINIRLPRKAARQFEGSYIRT